MTTSRSIVVALAVSALLVWVVAPALAQTFQCEQGLPSQGLNKFLGTIWGYLTGPAGKVLALMMGAFGIFEMVFTADRRAGIVALVGGALIAFAGDAINTLFGLQPTNLC
jgi:type IV secretory pathway VirB2 component (pilin)